MTAPSVPRESAAGHTRWSPAVLAVGACAIFMVLYFAFGWSGWGPPAAEESMIGAASRWCERVSPGLFREPINALSNLGFVVAGILMFRILARDRREPPRLNQFHGLTPVAVLYAGATVWLGPGSMLMHGTHTFWGAWADNLSMVMYILIPWLINVAEMGRWSVRRLLIVYVVLVTAYGIGYALWGPKMGINLELFPLSIVFWGISEVLYRFWSPRARWLSGFSGLLIAAAFGIMPWDMLAEPAEYWWVSLFWVPALLSSAPPRGRRVYVPWNFIGVATFMTAYAIWLTGRPANPWCQPDSWIQAHGIWHLMCAFATFCFFKFLRTERATRPAS